MAKENKELENKLNELEELAKKVTTWSLYFYKYGNTSIKNNKRKKAIFFKPDNVTIMSPDYKVSLVLYYKENFLDSKMLITDLDTAKVLLDATFSEFLYDEPFSENPKICYNITIKKFINGNWVKLIKEKYEKTKEFLLDKELKEKAERFGI